ncbi:cupin domain-containing protein [Roseospirillum parvum]|uniref:Helix-turn-helix domain-containing protein n=1 Tax=Roseospirillum parvum TaxID=83401 RepID=A0A1G7ZXR4_9PROT|nr:cupin domain-containing protein [Roseospirillum parvum]SDH13484.1 Helix-turn-helix domain-containing protein [Roseospirillum parvum]
MDSDTPPRGDKGFDLGARLRAIRDGRGLSQRELAKRAGVTNSTISLIEQNRVSPSVSSLKKVLDGIPMTLAEFFTPPSGGPTQLFFPADEMAQMSFGDLSLTSIGGRGEGRDIHLMLEHYQPGGDTGQDMITYPGEEAGLVLEGEIEVTVGDQVRRLVAGDGYHIDTGVPHRFRNPSQGPARVVSASTNALILKGNRRP